MNYNLKYLGVVKIKSPGYHEPYSIEEQEVAPHLYFTGRHFPCNICNKVTPFVDMTPLVNNAGEYVAHVCSDECRAQLEVNRAEIEQEQRIEILRREDAEALLLSDE